MPQNVDVTIRRSFDEWNGSKVPEDKTRETTSMIMMIGGIAITIVIVIGVLALVMIATSV